MRTGTSPSSATDQTSAMFATFIHDAVVDDLTRRRAAAAMVDTLAVTLAGGVEPPVRAFAGALDPVGTAGIASFWSDARYRGEDAALLFGMASQVLDYDDVSMLAVCHPTAPVLSAVLAVLLCGPTVPRLGWPWLEQALGPAMPWLGMGLAVLALTGLPHAFNIIDGYNGLAGMVATIICLALAHVALQVGDRTLAAMLVTLAAATCGFLVWNYPRGMMFAGDGGAYVWGLAIALASIALVQRNSAVSPWFPMLLLIYPVWETVFSIYRKLMRGMSPGMADALHFHQLIYRRIVRGVFDDDLARRMLRRNNRTSPYLWAFTLLTVVPALLFWSNTPVLVGFCLLFVVSYVIAYLAMVRFKLPGWMQNNG